MPTDALLLDVMGTLVHDPFFVEVPAFFGMDLDALLEVKHPDAWVRFERGELEEAAFLEGFFADGRAFSHEGFLAHLASAYRWLDGVEALLEELHRRGVPMVALSNYPTWYRLIEARLGVSRFLEWRFVSCHTGVRKPDPEAYLGAARALALPPERCLFVDDRASNVDAARAVGMDAVRFTDAETLRRDLVERGVL